MKFCSYCASPVVKRIPPGDTLPRYVCDQCGIVHYQNPLLVVGSIPEHEDRLLLCRRAIEPRYGYWTLPAGFMENEETAAEGAMREAMEEAHANGYVTTLVGRRRYIPELSMRNDTDRSAGERMADRKSVV